MWFRLILERIRYLSVSRLRDVVEEGVVSSASGLIARSNGLYGVASHQGERRM